MNHIIKKSQIKSDPTSGTRDGVPVVELLKDGDAVRAIEVRCSCGSSTVVRLEYAELQSAAANNG